MIGCCFLSSLDPHLPVHPPFCVLRPVATCIHAVPPTQTVLLSIPVHIARSRFLDQFRSRVLHHRSGPPQLLPLVRFVFSLLQSHISSAPRPFLSFPNLSRAVWSCPRSFILLPSRLPGPQLVSHPSFWYSSVETHCSLGRDGMDSQHICVWNGEDLKVARTVYYEGLDQTISVKLTNSQPKYND